ncbi:MAG: hypothetical protein GQ507_01385 [Dehalococcoidales bacterium]|jgi:hypothetical protein|nr:hypothetical protein [Dehalococcoidales bacterium]
MTLERKVNIAIVLALAFIALNVIDILLTWRGLRLGAVELNFYMNKVLGLGFLESVAFKLGVSAGFAAIMLDRGQFAALIGAVSILSLVCIWNLHVISNIL